MFDRVIYCVCGSFLPVTEVPVLETPFPATLMLSSLFYTVQAAVLCPLLLWDFEAPQINGKFVGRGNLTNTQLVSSAHQHFHKRWVPLFVGGDKHIVTDETYNVVHWSKHLVFVFFEGISLSMLHMWMIDGFHIFTFLK